MTRQPSPNLIRTLAFIACFGATPALAEAEPAIGRAAVLNPLSVVNTADLDFGTLVHGTGAGTATVNPTTGTLSTTGGVVSAGGTPATANFLATGVVNRLFAIVVGSNPVLTNGTGATMTVNPMMIDGPTLRLFGAGGTSTIRVGGVLNLAANQADGDYSGTFDLTIIYL
jgi:Domain of unknown function (DUF4402)